MRDHASELFLLVADVVVRCDEVDAGFHIVFEQLVELLLGHGLLLSFLERIKLLFEQLLMGLLLFNDFGLQLLDDSLRIIFDLLLSLVLLPFLLSFGGARWSRCLLSLGCALALLTFFIVPEIFEVEFGKVLYIILTN